MMTAEQQQTLKDAMALLSKEDHNGPGIITYTRAERQTLTEAFVLLRNQVENLEERVSGLDDIRRRASKWGIC